MSLKRDGPSAKPRVPANALLAACLVSVSGVRTVAATTLNRGAIFEGKYRIERHLGDGGMGSVYEAIHLQLHVPVALKLVRKGIGEAVDVEERFLREARAAARVRNEHVAQVLDVGRAESGESFIVMEFLDGFDLSEVETGETLPADAAVHYAMQVCHGMQVAHDRGVIHRDLKPSNLFVTTDARGRPLIKVLDFGISKQVGVRAGVITNSGNLM